jgi:Flp pilus assembly pilin Flp
MSSRSPDSKSKSLLRDTRGATAVEYALMLVAVLLIVAGAFKTLGQKVSEKANRAATELQ